MILLGEQRFCVYLHVYITESITEPKKGAQVIWVRGPMTF